MSWKKGVPYLVLLATLAGLTCASVAMADRTAVPADANPAAYVGTDTCLDCHDDKEDSFAQTRHGRTGMTTWDGAHGCESCHGPGAEHAKSKGRVQNMRNFADVDAREASDTCLQCHDRGEHADWWTSVHASRGLSCLSCHTIHHEGDAPDALLAKGNEFDTCRNCHLRKIANLARSSHMPVREESMTCSSCHNPHGGQGPAMLAQFSVNENCYSCHAEKRSPKLWEHAPVREDCTLCHDPHGSLHAHMTNAKIPRLCQQCHDIGRHPSASYVYELRDSDGDDEGDTWFPGGRLMCLNCHVNIHGSSHPAGARFVR